MQQLLESVSAALVADGDLLSGTERATIDALLAESQSMLQNLEAQGALAGIDADTVRAQVATFSQATDEFAARRMDRSIRAALSGRSVNEI